MENPQDKGFKRIFFFIALGCIIGSLIYSVNFYIVVGNIVFRASHLLIIAVWITSIELLLKICTNQNSIFIFLASGLSASIVTSYMFNNGNLYGNNNLFLNIIILITSLSILAYLLSFFKRKKKNISFSIKLRHFFAALTLMTITAVRVGNILTRNLPNESRSLMIAGIEFHHLFTGFLLISVSQLLLFYLYRNKALSNLFKIIYVIGLALIADQVAYILMVPLSDEAFFSTFSFSGALVCTLWILLRIYTFTIKDKTTVQPAN